ncbi:hypothetical protein [Pseudomonas monteilii]|uniref:hypothetical protein n=1 Tax=Pseudomonas monteilii TaxID=76759 RepID=UPI0036E5E4F7
MSDIENENGFDLGAMVTEMTDSAGVADDVGPGDAVPGAIADDVEDYAEHDQRQHGHLAEQEGDDVDEQVDGQPQGKGQRNVPLGALQEERSKRQQAQAQVAQLQAQMAAQQAQMQQFQQWQAQQQQAQQQAQIPAFEDDPEGNINARFEQLAAQQQAAQQADVQRRQFEQASAHVDQQLRQAGPIVAQIEAEFTAQHPDYSEAYAFLDKEVTARVQQQNPNATPEEHACARRWAMYSFLQNCADTNQNPAQLLYGEAQRLGFQSAHRTPLGQIKKAPTSLGAIPGGSRAPDDHGKLTASQLAQMSDSEFNEMFEQMRRSSGEGQFGF